MNNINYNYDKIKTLPFYFIIINRGIIFLSKFIKSISTKLLLNHLNKWKILIHH